MRSKMRMVMVVSLLVVAMVSAASAADFSWVKDFNIQAQADPSGFKARLAARFKIGGAQIDTVISSTKEPADAYMVFRLGEMSKRPPEEVLDRYKTGQGKGWGNLAKSLGIKPGSPEFHALKRGHDLNGGDSGSGKGKGKKEKKEKKHKNDD